MLWTDDVDNIDPGITYYQMGYMVSYATQRPLYSWKPDDGKTPVPDLAESDPQISRDGRTVTVKLRDGVRFSPPVSREVTSKDVKYAIERGFFNTVNNGYAGAYFGDLVGAAPAAEPGTEIKGIRTPDDRTIVFKLRRGSGGVLAGALALPLSAPVPEEYAAKFDRQNPSAYGQNQVATGPYMIENDAAGRAIGYEAGRRIHLVRNPNWDQASDYKPAYVDEIEMPQGNDDTTVASRKVVEGQGMLTGDFSPPPAVLAQVVKREKDQLVLVPAGSARYVSMNTTVEPFDDIDVRRAVVAGFDREAMRLVRGGELVGDIPTHMIPPGMPGFEESGGYDGFGLDYPIKIVRFDAQRQQPMRDERGFCIECSADEPGEVIGRIVRDSSKPGARFEGYASKVETEQKVLKDVFKKGDTWFRTGDLMRKDKLGYFYFIDRIGDTFRWKGENVSTTEVELALGRFDSVLEANVYGVAVQGRDGRAGMAAIVAKDNLNLTALRDHLAQLLPDYARPVFLRIRRDIDVTATFKQKKVDLVQEGFDPGGSPDPIYFNDPQRKAFVRIDPDLYQEINAGKIRL